MTDVVLTATNPEDSSVVPVACNEKGELKLEEPIVTPPFDGSYDGNVDFGASLNVHAQISAGTDGSLNRAALTATNDSDKATVFIRNDSDDTTAKLIQVKSTGWAGFVFELTQPGDLSVRGSATFTPQQVGFTSDGELVFYSRGTRYKAVVQGGNLMADEFPLVLLDRDEKDDSESPS